MAVKLIDSTSCSVNYGTPRKKPIIPYPPFQKRSKIKKGEYLMAIEMDASGDVIVMFVVFGYE